MKCISLGVLAFISSMNLLSAQEKGWVIEADPLKEKNYYGETVANGMLGIVSDREPLKTSNVILAGVYDIPGKNGVSKFLKGFDIVNLDLSIDGETVSSQNISDYKQSLNMKEGSFSGSFDFKGKAKVTYTLRALRHLPYTGTLSVEIVPTADVSIATTHRMNPSGDIKNGTYEEGKVGHLRFLTGSGMTPSGRLKLAATSGFYFEKGKEAPQVDFLIEEDKPGQMSFKKELKSGEPFSYTLVGSTISSWKHSDPLNESKRLTIFGLLEGNDKLVTRHNQEWGKLWESDIIIEGDDFSQVNVRSMLYHLYAFIRKGSGLSISPMGLSGFGYNGHIFWDADIWMAPALIMLQPELAESMVQYRVDRLDQARERAFAYGYKGAMYPWESADQGSEDTPIFALTGPFEHHITGCVAHMAWKYYCATQDKEWLREKGFPIIKETADYWTSRATYNPERKVYEILNVVCPDEYAENVDNNGFTNAIAKENMRNATRIARLLGEKINPDWEKIADKLVIETMEDGTIAQFKGYNGQRIKQADTVLMAYPLDEIKDKKLMQKNLEYYAPKTNPRGPAMTWSIHSIQYNWLGDTEKAYEIFLHSFKNNLLPPFGVLSEEAGSTNPYFITGAGGTLQAVLVGFGGLKITPKGVEVGKGFLPSAWKSLTITGVGKDKRTVKVTRSK